jgi:hypothetical protein
MEGNVYSQLLSIMKKQGYNKDTSILIGTILNPLPNLRIQLGNLVLEREDVLVAEQLTTYLSQYKVLNAPTDSGSCNSGYQANAYPSGHVFEVEHQSRLKTNDKVILLRDEDLFIVVDKVV